MNPQSNQTALDLLFPEQQIGQLRDAQLDIYRQASRIIDQTHIAMGRKPVYKTSSISTSDVKLNLNATSSSTENKN